MLPSHNSIIASVIQRNISYFYLTLTILTSVYSQIVIKWRISNRFSDVRLPENLRVKILLLFTVVFDPFILSGLTATFISGLFWMATMTKLDISYAYPFTSLAFVLVLIFSYLLLGEPMSVQKVLGVFFIMLGIFITSKG